MSDIKLIDTTLRDGHQSLWALGMKNEMMLPVLELIDNAGYDEAEFYIPQVQLFKAATDLGENALDWLDYGAPLAKKTPLRMHGGMETGFRYVPQAVHRLMLRRQVDLGVNVNRCSDPWNNYQRLAPALRELVQIGFKPIVNLTYTVSPVHTDEYYQAKAREARSLDIYRLCFKDVGGLLTPDRARVLMPKIVEAAGDLDVEFHAHCNSGFAPVCNIEAARAGIKYIHTAIPPLSDGSSQPSVFTTLDNLREAGFSVDMDADLLRRVSEHFFAIARRDGLPIGRPPEFDLSLYRHQVPGGMISNLEFQMAKIGQRGRLGETLEEAAQVREDFGYPIMITPLSQFVGTQAALNVVAGERYKMLSDHTVEFALGYWGEEAIDAMNQDVRDKILSSPRAKELAKAPPKIAFVGAHADSEETLAQARARYGAHICDEELLLRAYAGEKGGEVYSHHKAPVKGAVLGANTVVDLIDGLTRAGTGGSISVSKGSFSIKLSSSQE